METGHRFIFIHELMPAPYKDVLALTKDGQYERAYYVAETMWIASADGSMLANVVAWQYVTVPKQFRRE